MCNRQFHIAPPPPRRRAVRHNWSSKQYCTHGGSMAEDRGAAFGGSGAGGAEQSSKGVGQVTRAAVPMSATQPKIPPPDAGFVIGLWRHRMQLGDEQTLRTGIYDFRSL